MKLKPLHLWPFILLAIVLLTWSQVAADEGAKTIIGPRNVPLAEGVAALNAGNAEEGVRLSLRGLAIAQGNREKKILHSNLCAGYLMMDKPRTALEHCNQSLAIDPDFWRAYNNRALVYLRLERFEESAADVERGQALRPSSTKLKEVRGMLLDETNPVVEKIEVDERRSSGSADEGDADTGDADD